MLKKLFAKKETKKEVSVEEFFKTIDTINLQLDQMNQITMNKVNQLNNIISEMQRA